MKALGKTLILSGSVLAGLLLATLALKSFSCTPRIANGISEIRKVKLGGINQSFSIRGENRDSPVLLYLHGGPGSTELIPFRLFHQALEKYFTVVVWEQRGTGKSYSPSIPRESMTIDQFVSDAHELTEYLKTDFKKDKILVVGHSWGSILGLLLVQKYPESYFAYVGSGQEVIPSEAERIGYRYLLAKAKDKPAAMKELAKLDIPEPYLTIDSDGRWFEKAKTDRKWMIALGGEIYNRSDYSLFFNGKTLTAPEYTWMDFVHFARGSVFSLKEMWPQVMRLDFMKQVPEISIPVFFFQGRHDYVASSSLVEKYAAVLKAPTKELVWFEGSGHDPIYEEAAAFDRLLIERVLPRCQ